jgi:hypothetical protein
MAKQVGAFARAARWGLPTWAAMLLAGTLTHRPDAQAAFPDLAKYVTTTGFLWSHLANGITGAATGPVGAGC